MPARATRLPPGPAWTIAAVVVAVLSLPFGHALAFDASAWVVWGRELWSLSLDTSAGPSWKPLPVLFTAPFAVLGDASGAAWLVVARAGALLAVVGAARLAARVAGPWGAVVAVVAIVASPWWLLNAALGNADPLLGGLVVWALLAAGDDRPRTAFALLVAGALVRPEIWPFVAGYGLWLVYRRRIALGPGVAAGVGVLALWVVPDLLASGLESTKGATGTPSAGSAGLTDVPFLTVWADLIEQGPWVVIAAAVAGAVLVVRGGDRRPDVVVWLAAAGAYVLLVATMAQLGFAGNPRYLVPALTVLAAAAGTIVIAAGGSRLGDGERPRGWGRPVLAVVVVAAIVASTAGQVRDQARTIDARADSRRALVQLVVGHGGAGSLTRCGPVRTDPTTRTVVAERLHESIPAAARRATAGEPTLRATSERTWTLAGDDCRSPPAHP